MNRSETIAQQIIAGLREWMMSRRTITVDPACLTATHSAMRREPNRNGTWLMFCPSGAQLIVDVDLTAPLDRRYRGPDGHEPSVQADGSYDGYRFFGPLIEVP